MTTELAPHPALAELAMLRKPDLATDRPTSHPPIYHQIPAEIQARRQWVCWRYETVNGKLTKVPYNPRTAGLAKTNAPRTWGTFLEAKQAYIERSDFFDGIGYVFSKNDPYCGADFDHCRNPETGEISNWAAGYIAALRAAGAYIEISVSGTGVHAITRAIVGKGIKKTLGEVYDRGRYFTMSGQALDPTPIGDGQATIDALRAELRGIAGDTSHKAPRDGSAGNGDRAALAAKYEAEFEQGRQLNRTTRDLLLKRFLLATAREETQLGKVNQGHYAARLLWAELHQRCPHIGLYRLDGSLDDSQTRATMGRAIYGRGFSFAQYTVIMSYHFAAAALAKWGTKQAWREELAAIWENAIENTRYTPRGPTPRPAVAKKPKGRSSNHRTQVERVYSLLVERKIGDKAIVKTADLAAECGMHRVTLAGILAELRSAKRIATERLGQYGGLIISFSDVAIPAELPIETAPAAPPIEETKDISCVSSETREGDYSRKPRTLGKMRKMCRRHPSLSALASFYLDQPVPRLPHQLLDRDTGELVLDEKLDKAAYRRTAKHFAGLVVASYGRHYTTEQAIEAYETEKNRRAELARQEWRRFYAWLDKTTGDELIAYIGGGCRAEVAAMCRGAQKFNTHMLHTRLEKAKERLAKLGLTMPTRKTRTQAAADESRQIVEQAAKTRRAARRPVACQPVQYEKPPRADRALIATLYRLQEKHDDAQRVLGGAA